MIGRRVYWYEIATYCGFSDFNVHSFTGICIGSNRNSYECKPESGTSRYVDKDMVKPTLIEAKEAAIKHIGWMRSEFNRCMLNAIRTIKG